ncbi:Uncharacterized protein TCM_038446 [Theobroma cacao]|uniref:Uncharacterized protein n=2 Tax=Theobroma cacao TaxID=3641 RepID=A0A061GNT1_THECC|nr:Uncharacterized protein TCM_038446 [Theobroma cacao]
MGLPLSFSSSHPHYDSMVILNKCSRKGALSNSLAVSQIALAVHECQLASTSLLIAKLKRHWLGSLIMGNKPVKQEQREEILLKIVPPLDQAYVRWLARDIERIHGFTPRNPRAVKPPDHYIEYMRLNGWLDVKLDDPDLAHLFN